jgi:hypothetical protein
MFSLGSRMSLEFLSGRFDTVGGERRALDEGGLIGGGKDIDLSDQKHTMITVAEYRPDCLVTNGYSSSQSGAEKGQVRVSDSCKHHTGSPVANCVFLLCCNKYSHSGVAWILEQINECIVSEVRVPRDSQQEVAPHEADQSFDLAVFRYPCSAIRSG